MVVLDKHGKPVKNLKASDIQLTEDEVKQDITSFRFISPAERAHAANASKAAVAPLAGPRSLRGVNLVCLVLQNLDPVSRRNAIDAAKEFLKTELPPGNLRRNLQARRQFRPGLPVYRAQTGCGRCSGQHVFHAADGLQ